jgi:hypothetical protein
LLEAVFEAQARRPWAFPAEQDGVPEGVEIEGFVGRDRSLVLFPRTFYEIANTYFGRTAAHRSDPAGDAGLGEEIAGAHPSLTGALRRLSENGYMRADVAELAHQVQPIEVYVFAAA